MNDVTGTKTPHLFRSYHHPESHSHNILERNPGRPDEHQIWQIGRATCATPLYFKPMTLEEEDEIKTYIDGGFGSNNHPRKHIGP